MTNIFYVRHAEADYSIKDNLTRPLTKKGLYESKFVSEFLSRKGIGAIFSSPYKRAIDTISDFADSNKFEIKIIEDLREREIGEWVEDFDLFAQKQWNDFGYKKYGGESLSEVQDRNIRVIKNILNTHPSQNVVVVGHGTALSTILNYYEKSFSYEDFLKLKPKTPCIVEFIFDNVDFVKTKQYEIL